MERWSEGSGLALRRYDGVTVEQRAVLLKRCAHFSIGKPGAGGATAAVERVDARGALLDLID